MSRKLPPRMNEVAATDHKSSLLSAHISKRNYYYIIHQTFIQSSSDTTKTNFRIIWTPSR